MKRKISPDREITLPVSLANVDSRLDLFFAPENTRDGLIFIKIMTIIILVVRFLSVRKRSKKIIGKNCGYVGTIKIEWEK